MQVLSANVTIVMMSVKRALGWVLGMVAADVRVMVGIACGFGVNCKGMCGVLGLPMLNKTVDRLDQAMLGDGVEEAHEVIVCGMEVDVGGSL